MGRRMLNPCAVGHCGATVSILLWAILLVLAGSAPIQAQGVIGQSHAQITVSAIGHDRATVTLNINNGVTVCPGHVTSYCGGAGQQTGGGTSVFSQGYTGTPLLVTGLSPETDYTVFAGTRNHGFSRRQFTTTAAPAAPVPGNFRVLSTGTNTITVDWDESSGATGYEIGYGTVSSGAFASSVTVDTSVTYRAVSQLLASTQYQFRIRSIKSGVNSAWSTTIQGTTRAASVSAPTDAPTVTCTSITETSAMCSWTAVDRAGAYSWTFATNSGTETTRALSLTQLAAGTTYTLSVQGRNTGGVGPAGTATFTTLVPIPSGSTTVTVTSVTATGAVVSWTAVTGATTYRVVYTPAGGQGVQVTTTAVSRTLAGLTASTVYAVVVQAGNSRGYASSSGTGTFTTAAVQQPGGGGNDPPPAQPDPDPVEPGDAAQPADQVRPAGDVDVVAGLIRIADGDDPVPAATIPTTGYAAKLFGPTFKLFLGSGTGLADSNGLFRAGRIRSLRLGCVDTSAWMRWIRALDIPCLIINFIPISIAARVDIFSFAFFPGLLLTAWALIWTIRKLLSGY